MSARHRRRTSVRLGAVFGVPEFRAMWLGEFASTLGDQLARVALAVLVFDRTGSAGLTGLTYALTFVPAFLGGAVFGSLGDRHPRRSVMIGADVGRAITIGTAAIPGTPLWLLCGLVAVTTFLTGPFKAAQQALLPTVLPDRLYTPGMTVRTVSIQAAQLIGFAGGGVLVTAIRPSVGLLIDAATFAFSAGVLYVGTRRRPAAAAARLPFVRSMVDGARLVAHDPMLRALTGLCWLAGFYVVPEALAAPYAGSLGGGAVVVGLIMASDPAGSVLGGTLFGKWMPEHTQQRILGLLGVLAGLPLIACTFTPPLPVSMALFALSGACATVYTVQGVAMFTRRLPDGQRAQGTGLLATGMTTVQGLGALLAGVLADSVGAGHSIALLGTAGTVCAALIAGSLRRIARRESWESDLAGHGSLSFGPGRPNSAEHHGQAPPAVPTAGLVGDVRSRAT